VKLSDLDGMSLIKAVDEVISRDWEHLFWHPEMWGLRIVPLGCVVGWDGTGLRSASSGELSGFTWLLNGLRSGERRVHSTRCGEGGAWSLAVPTEHPLAFWRLSGFRICRTPPMLGDTSASGPFFWFAEPTINVPAFKKPPRPDVAAWMLERAKATGGKLKLTDELRRECKTATGCNWDEAGAAHRHLPKEYRFGRGQH